MTVQMHVAPWVALAAGVLVGCGGGNEATTPAAASASPQTATTHPVDNGSDAAASRATSSDEARVAQGITGASCRSTGSVTLSKTHVVAAGQTFDGQCQTFNPSFDSGDQSEGQDPVFRVEKGGTLKNVIIGNNGADGVHLYGDATVDNVTWTNVGEDALTVKSAGHVTIRNITGTDASDKFFQLNAPTTMTVDNAIINGASKIVRENEGKCYPVDVTIQRANLSNVRESVFRSDCNRSTFLLTHSTLSNVKTVCYAGGKYASCGAQ